MFELVFLGTSASAPSIHRGLPALVVIAAEARFLIDCGEGTQRQILRSGIGFKRLNRILLTHEHLDHILGLGGLISTFSRWEKDNLESITIWGGDATLARVRALLFDVVLHGEPPLPIDLISLHTAPRDPLLTFKDFTVSAFPVVHRGSSSFGYVFQEKSRRPFLVEQAEALGVPAGPERGLLVAGKSITLADGRTIQPEQVLGAAIPGAKLVVIGDIGRLDNVKAVVANADTLVIEATFLSQDADAARYFGHLTAARAAELAAEMGVRSLVLTHVSRRYRESDIQREAQRIFPNTVVARDLDHLVVRRGVGAEKLDPQVSRARFQAEAAESGEATDADDPIDLPLKRLPR
jgi:ribonuclease Z